VVERGVRYVKVDDSARQIVFDMQALFSDHGGRRQDPDSIQYGNTASWLVGWLSKVAGPSGWRCSRRFVDVGARDRIWALSKEPRRVLSRSCAPCSGLPPVLDRDRPPAGLRARPMAQ